ncbi:MAG: cyclic pyranopterin monophosphate synthase MoaC [Nitrospiraceae bacterium]|jgi:cyclic pyranopterin monophosphate synthase|nr:MAG: cyclic pyranopterin monophosphate synthase MoaC [Nitrospiraceae bacterium]
MTELTHFDEHGKARMVDVSGKPVTEREAVARGKVSMNKSTLRMIRDSKIAKGDVLGVARVAGIMAAKKTAELIPMCHPLNIASVNIDFDIDTKNSRIQIESRVRITGQTGVEMEALTAVSAAALTIYDMCKSADRGMIISDIMLVEKRGGKSGVFKR